MDFYSDGSVRPSPLPSEAERKEALQTLLEIADSLEAGKREIGAADNLISSGPAPRGIFTRWREAALGWGVEEESRRDVVAAFQHLAQIVLGDPYGDETEAKMREAAKNLRDIVKRLSSNDPPQPKPQPGQHDPPPPKALDTYRFTATEAADSVGVSDQTIRRLVIEELDKKLEERKKPEEQPASDKAEAKQDGQPPPNAVDTIQFTTTEAADYVKVSVSTIRRRIRNHTLDATDKADGFYEFNRPELDAYKESVSQKKLRLKGPKRPI